MQEQKMATPTTFTTVNTTDITNVSDFADIPTDTKLTNILLPNEWIVYLYDKQLFKKLANKANFQAKPHKAVYTLKTVNDVVYLLKIMGVKLDVKLDVKTKQAGSIAPKINLDANDLIIMRKGIEPIWEDPKNSNGGTFTAKMAYQKGYNIWSNFVSAMLGETMTSDMENINGMTISYIPDVNSYQTPNSTPICYSYLKIWDGATSRSKEQFINILSPDLYDMIKTESLMYTPNSKKKDFNEKSIIAKLSNGSGNKQYRNSGAGGFGGFNKKRY